ncbi:RNA polymerase sigma factor [Sphingobacterium lactis]|uniref:RNA polymerase sigma factor n=1 Tax=Sphingobacterium lactis TaxID=797291 RepID=UPI003DA2076C
MKGTLELTNEKLLDKIRLGEEIAFQEFYYRFQGKVKGFAFKFSGNWEEAKEIAQETFVKLWENRERIRSDQSPEALLYVMVKHNIMDKWKKKLQYNTYLKVLKNDLDHDDSTQNYISFQETKLILENLVCNLPYQAQKVYKLSREDGYTHQQIADELHISTNTVSNHIKRSIKKIKKLYLLNYSEVITLIFILILF